MRYKDAEAYIHSLTRFGSQLGLERMRKLLEYLGNPQDKLKFIHIAGTNGKGSTAQMCTRILKEAGYTVGTYISPFVVDFRERFQVNGKMIEKSEFADLTERVDFFVKQMSKEGMQVTEFEMITAIAFMFFCERKCDIVCLEVGLGGKFDATNVIKTPECAVITSVSMDHTDILGDTIEKIAGEKAGIIKENTDVITYPLQDSSAVAVLMEKCAETESRLIIPNANAITIDEISVLGSKFSYNENSYKIKLAGIHQIYNAAAVIECMRILSGKGFSITKENIYNGLKAAKFAARFEIMSKNPIIILDGAHNKEGAEALGNTLDRLDKKKIAVMGMLKDKDYKSAAYEIGRRCERIITIPVNNPRAAEPEVLADALKEFCRDVSSVKDYREALEKAINQADEDTAVIVCGSLYMASDMRKVIKEYLKEKKDVKR